MHKIKQPHRIFTRCKNPGAAVFLSDLIQNERILDFFVLS